MRTVIAALCLWSALVVDGRSAGPEGYDLVTCTFRTGDLELFAVDPVSGKARNLTNSPKSTDKYPGVSPDGTRLAFISDREGRDALFVMDADGSDVRRLAKGHDGNAGMPSWTADSQWIYFGLYAAGPDKMCRIHPDGSDFQEIARGVDPAVSPDGRRIAYDGKGLHVMDADGSNPRRLAEPNGLGGLHATWTPDSKAIIYADTAGDSLELFRCDPDTGAKTQLTHFGAGRAATSPAVSPDGKWITFRLCDEIYWINGERAKLAYSERRPDKRPVWIMGADGSDPHVVGPLHLKTTIDGSRAPFLKRQ